MSNHDKVIIIAGMHRSGTTLTARWLQTCGLNIGEHLLKSKYDHANPEGLHYEDMDFLQLHRSILKSMNLDTDGLVTDEPINISPVHHAGAKSILQSRRNLSQWGWKEPRTSLLLDFWMEQLPSAKILVMLRSYEQVADSLLRRKLDHEKFLRRLYYRLRFRPIRHFASRYVRVWTRYNGDILATIERHPESTIVLKTSDVIEHGDRIIEYLRQGWGFELTPVDAGTIFDKTRLHKGASYVDINDPYLEDAVREAHVVYEKLSKWRVQSLQKLASGHLNDE